MRAGWLAGLLKPAGWRIPWDRSGAQYPSASLSTFNGCGGVELAGAYSPDPRAPGGRRIADRLHELMQQTPPMLPAPMTSKALMMGVPLPVLGYYTEDDAELRFVSGFRIGHWAGLGQDEALQYAMELVLPEAPLRQTIERLGRYSTEGLARIYWTSRHVVATRLMQLDGV